jgi:hypothetical protein
LIGLVAVTFVATVCLLFYHSQWKVYRDGRPATALFVVEAPKDWEGLVVVAEQHGVPMAKGKLKAENNYTVRLQLVPGTYQIWVQHERGVKQRLKIWEERLGDHAYLLYRPGGATTRPR